MLLTLSSFAGFTALVLGLSYYLTRKKDASSSEGYFLAGRGLTGWVIAASLLLTNLSTEQMVGLNGQGYMFNMSGMGYEIGASLALIIVAFFFLPRYVLILLPTVLYSGAIGMGGIVDIMGTFHLSPMMAIIVVVVAIGVLGCLYTIFGGLRIMAIADTISQQIHRMTHAVNVEDIQDMVEKEILSFESYQLSKTVNPVSLAMIAYPYPS